MDLHTTFTYDKGDRMGGIAFTTFTYGNCFELLFEAMRKCVIMFVQRMGNVQHDD